MSYLARTVTPADGATDLFPVSFPLPPVQGRLGVAVYVYLSGAAGLGAPKTVGVDFNWVSDGQITFLSGHRPTAGQVVDIRRVTDNSELDNILSAGGSLRSAELVQNDTQLLYILQEVADGGVEALARLGAIPPIMPAAPMNLLPNTQWEIITGMLYGLRYKTDATGLLPTCNLISHTFGTATPVLTVDGVPAGWKVGHLVKCSVYNPTSGTAMGDYVVPITAIAGVTITVLMPQGIKPAGTGTGTLTNVSVGNSASVGTGDAADYWKKPLATTIWREDDPTAQFAGSLHCLGIAKGTNGVEAISYQAPDVVRYKGRQVVFGATIKQKARTGGPSTFRVFISCDGTGGGTTYSAMGVGDGTAEYREVTAAIPADATFFQVGLETNDLANATYHFANPMLSYGNYLGANGYTKPRERLIPLVKCEPHVWVNATINFPAASTFVGFDFPVDWHGDSWGQIARSVRLMEGSIEGLNNLAVQVGSAGSRLIGWVDTMPDPIKTGPFMSQQVQNVKCHRGLRVPLVGGKSRCFSGIASDVWSNVSIDLDAFTLE